MKYWEKTVEYAFLTFAIQENKVNFAAPLSGKLERGAGDAVFAQDSSYILVEFKADASGMSDEEPKFLDYDQAKKALAAKDGHHFFVYVNHESNRLPLASRTYFSRKTPSDDNESALGCFARGVDKIAFDEYLREFLNYRRRDERGNGGVELSDYATVIGVAPNSDSAIACSLQDYASHFTLDIVPSPESESAPDVSPRCT